MEEESRCTAIPCSGNIPSVGSELVLCLSGLAGQRRLDVRFLGQGIASLPDSLPGAPSNMSDAGSRSSFQGASPGS